LKAATIVEPQLTVRVLLNPRGQWEVVLPGRRRPFRCQSLEEAERVAYSFAARRRPCEIVVHDAYHRVLLRDVINGSPPSGSPGRGRPARSPLSKGSRTNTIGRS
jgi:hypothetical protein